jgi:hypothetical protein
MDFPHPTVQTLWRRFLVGTSGLAITFWGGGDLTGTTFARFSLLNLFFFAI